MRNVFMLNSIRIALLLVLVALYLAPAVAATVRGTTLVDSLQMSPGDTRTTPRFPRAGTFGIIVGGAVPGTAGRGVLCNKPGSAVIFPSRLLLNGTAGTIELSMLLDAPLTAATPISTLLETPVGDNGTIFLRLTLENTTLKLAMRNKAGRIVSIEADVKDWQVKNLHTVMILWDAKGVTLRVDGRNAAV
ncbi:MAG: hypothetical protein WCJ56_14390, partial [bacterium]